MYFTATYIATYVCILTVYYYMHKHSFCVMCDGSYVLVSYILKLCMYVCTYIHILTFSVMFCLYVLYPNQNYPNYKNVMTKTWKGCGKKGIKSKGGSQGLCSNAVDHIKIFDTDSLFHKHLCHNVLHPGSLVSKFLM